MEMSWLRRRSVKPSATIFFLFFILFAVYSLVTMKGKLSDVAVKYAIILLLSVVLTAAIDLNFFSFTLLTLPVILLTIMTQYGSGAVASYIAYSAGFSTASGTHSIALLWLHDTLSVSEAGDTASIIGLALLNGVAEEALFTGAIYSGASRFTKAKYVAALISAFLFAAYHSQAYLQVTPVELLSNPTLWSGKAWLLLSPFITQLVKCALFHQEAKRGGGLLGVSLGHAAGNGLLMLAALGGM